MKEEIELMGQTRFTTYDEYAKYMSEQQKVGANELEKRKRPAQQETPNTKDEQKRARNDEGENSQADAFASERAAFEREREAFSAKKAEFEKVKSRFWGRETPKAHDELQPSTTSCKQGPVCHTDSFSQAALLFSIKQTVEQFRGQDYTADEFRDSILEICGGIF